MTHSERDPEPAGGDTVAPAPTAPPARQRTTPATRVEGLSPTAIRFLQQALRAMTGVKAWPSDANMILVRVPDAQKAFDGMKARGVLVKNVSRMHPLLANCLRLTVGTADENGRMLAALAESL